MKRLSALLCAFLLLLTLFVGCGSDDTHTAVSCADVIAAYEEAGYAVWHQEYTEGERDYVCEISAENENGDTIYFTFFASAAEAEQYVKDGQWNVLLWMYSLVSGDPTWVHTEAYDTIAVRYENADVYAPFEKLI